LTQVTATKTPASGGEILGALQAAGVSANAAVMLAAQSALETGGWVSMWNWNLGDVTTNTGDFFILGNNKGHFTSLPDLNTGAAYFVNYLNGHGLIPYAEAGDLAGYVARLTSFGYAAELAQPGGPEAYQAGMAGWMSKLGGVTPTTPATVPTPTTPATVPNPIRTALIVSAILLASAATAYYIVEGELPDPRRIFA
jgi:hypothetical protein